jgi:hypothetical protein
MFILLVIGCSVLVALARGGRLANLANLRIRFVWLLFIPFLLQLLAFFPRPDFIAVNDTATQWIYAVSMGLAVVALLLNRHLPGVIWIAAGLLLNILVISLNGGFMPVSAAARAVAGLPELTARETNVVPMTAATVLPWLGDILPLPAFLPFATVYSPGDVLITIGGVIFTQRVLVQPNAKPNRQTDN